MSTLLMGTGCGEDESASNDASNAVTTASQTFEAWSVKETTKADLEKYFNVESRSNAGADQALAAMGLDSPSDNVSWASMDGSDGNYTYSGLTFAADDGEMTASEMSLHGVDMADGAPSFDKLVLSGAKMESDDGQGSIDRLMVADPHPEVASAILSSLSQMDSMDDFSGDVDLDDGEMPFGAMLLEGVDVSSEGNTVKVATLGWGADETSGLGSLLLSDLAINAVNEDNGHPVSISVGTASGSDINLAIFDSMKGDMDAMSAHTNPMKGEGAGNLLVKDVTMNVDTLAFSLTSLKVASTQEGDVSTQKMQLDPMTVRFSGEPSDFEMMEAYNALQSMGFEELVFTANMVGIYDKADNTVIVKDSVFSLEDGFDMAMDMKLSGVEDDDVEPDPLIHNISFALTDRSILDKAFAYAAEMQGGNPKLIRQQAKAGLSMAAMMVETPEERKLVSTLTKPLVKFIDEGGTLVFNINPPTPMRASELENMGDGPEVLETMGLSLTHQE